MPKYIVYGGCLSAPFAFPQLPEADLGATPIWTIVEALSSPELSGLEFLGEKQIADEAKVRLYRSLQGFRLHYDDSGIFDLSSDGSSILWAPGADATDENLREDVLGPVLAMAMHLSGRLCLHGSSVVLPTGAVAFLAPKHHGKSTLAMATLARGAKLLTDDSLPVGLGPPVMAHPGVASVRMWEDTRDRFYRDGATVIGAGGKHATTNLVAKAQLYEPQPLRAIYLLAPFSADRDVEPVRRKRVSSIESALALVQHAKIGALLGKTEGPVLLERAAAVSRSVPVYALHITRDLDSLSAVVDRLFDWHAPDQKIAADT